MAQIEENMLILGLEMYCLVISLDESIPLFELPNIPGLVGALSEHIFTLLKDHSAL